LECPPRALWAFSAENLFYIFGIAERLRAFRYPIFTGEDRVPKRRAFAESGAATAVFLYDLSCENGFQESPQTFLKPEIINNSSAIDVHSAAEHIKNRLTVRFVWTSP
jgi:hypothetical protein